VHPDVMLGECLTLVRRGLQALRNGASPSRRWQAQQDDVAALRQRMDAATARLTQTMNVVATVSLDADADRLELPNGQVRPVEIPYGSGVLSYSRRLCGKVTGRFTASE